MPDYIELLFSYKNYPDLFNKVEAFIYLLGIVINYKNINLRFLFLLLFLFQLFDAYALSGYMAIIKPFYLEHLVESFFAFVVCLLILRRAKIAGWVHYDSRYLGYMQEFGLIAVYFAFAFYSFVLFCEGVLYLYTDLIPNPLPIFSIRLYFYYALEAIEIYILCSLTVQNLNGKLPRRYAKDM